ncbi:MAG TPA: dihydroorotate dehydrogenase electron transfer subunit [Rectinemataceae bacterium]|nr:dihydroorotate dehydrogenase electron transfer subunit [Rectinemataceae bacterium]
MKHFESEILANRSMAESWRELVLKWDPSAGRPAPGQFFTFRASASTDPLLRRPLAFSAADEAGSSVSAVYQVRGQATRLLGELASGARIDLIGPLGRPFPRPRPGERPLLAAGGVGIGPVLFLARELAAAAQKAAPFAAGAAAGIAAGATAGAGAGATAGATAAATAAATAGPAPILVLGFRSASAVPTLDLPPGAIVCTDDGSRGFRGTLVDWLERDAPEGAARVYACGPAAMLAALAALARRRGWTSSLSAEQWMACGVGACMGCALPRIGGGYARVCADGPVFDGPAADGGDGGGEIDWAEAAR